MCLRCTYNYIIISLDNVTIICCKILEKFTPSSSATPQQTDQKLITRVPRIFEQFSSRERFEIRVYLTREQSRYTGGGGEELKPDPGVTGKQVRSQVWSLEGSRREISEGSVRAFRLSSSSSSSSSGVYAHRPFTRACRAIRKRAKKNSSQVEESPASCRPRADRRRDKTRKLTVIPSHLFSLYASREITRREHVVFCIMQLGEEAGGWGGGERGGAAPASPSRRGTRRS